MTQEAACDQRDGVFLEMAVAECCLILGVGAGSGTRLRLAVSSSRGLSSVANARGRKRSEGSADGTKAWMDPKWYVSIRTIGNRLAECCFIVEIGVAWYGLVVPPVGGKPKKMLE